MSGSDALRVLRCVSCHSQFLPRPGRCPKCGSSSIEAEDIAPVGRVLAATELTTPSLGWPAPHRIALVELAGGVRLLAVAPHHRP
ncbi:MAG: Zn-ribbon domain-containing OB-fold protein, partial [Thermoplasmata archaeon]